MGTLSLTHTLTAGTPENVGHVQTNFQDVVTYANAGNVGPENMEILPACRVYSNGDIPVITSTNVVVPFNTERFDTAGMHDSSVNNTRVTFTVAGVYIVSFNSIWRLNTAGRRVASIRLNGTTTIAIDDRPSNTAGFPASSVSTIYSFGAGDYVEAIVFQDSGSGFNLASEANYSPELSAAFLTRAS